MESWQQAIIEARLNSSLEIDATQISQTYPIATDWLKQDIGITWEHFLEKENRHNSEAKALDKVFSDISTLGGRTKDLIRQRKSITKLEESQQEKANLSLYIEACERRRELRLKTLIEKHSPIAFAQHHTFQMSFIGYTEGLSDARHERFSKQARNCLY